MEIDCLPKPMQLKKQILGLGWVASSVVSAPAAIPPPSS